MNTKQTLLVLALSSVLVACGSSSSLNTTKSDNNTTQTGKTDSGTTDNGKTDSGKTDSGTTDNGKTDSGKTDSGKTDSGKTDKPKATPITGILVEKDSAGKPAWGNLSDNTDINTIIVNGVSMKLLPDDYTSSSLYKKEKIGGKTKYSEIISGNDYKYSRFGVINGNDSANREFALFAQGNVTKKLPITGQFVYTGDAIGAVQGIGGWNAGKSEITVDFGKDAKKVTGKLYGWENNKMPTFTFDAKINAGGFSGDTVQGKFFGPNAEELGGVLKTTHNGKLAAASFGAKK